MLDTSGPELVWCLRARTQAWLWCSWGTPWSWHAPPWGPAALTGWRLLWCQLSLLVVESMDLAALPVPQGVWQAHCITLTGASLPLVVTLPLMKRIVYWPHLALGKLELTTTISFDTLEPLLHMCIYNVAEIKMWIQSWNFPNQEQIFIFLCRTIRHFYWLKKSFVFIKIMIITPKCSFLDYYSKMLFKKSGYGDF